MNKINILNNGVSLQLTIRDEADQSVVGEIFRHHEYRTVDKIIKLASDPIIDIGAHAGFFSLYVRSLNPSVRIVAVEPEPENIKQLKNHISLNQIKNIEIYEGAVAADSGRRHLQISKDNHNHKLCQRGQEIDKSIIVSSWSLSEILKRSIINKVSLVKIDVEGGEYEIFTGLKKSDFENIKYFFVEYHNNIKNRHRIIEENLRENGFGVSIFPSKFDKKMGFIFATNKRK